MGDELHEDWGTEIVRRYAEATRDNRAIEESAPKILRPMDLESYRQERAFYGKHETTHEDREKAWSAASTLPNESRPEEASAPQLRLGL